MSAPGAIILGLFAVTILSGASFAGCAYDAYVKACSACTFDEKGRIDKSCQGGYQSSGTACVSTSFPIMSAAYTAGKCPQVDECAAELRSCTAQYVSGNDKADCQEGSVGVCYSAADACTSAAARSCGEIEKQCPGSGTGFVLLLLGAGFVGMKGAGR